MKLTISFTNLEHTPSLDERIQEKSQKLDKYLEKSSHMKWSCYVKDNGHHYAEVDVVCAHFEYHATAGTDSLYKSIDKVISKLEKQMAKRKDKLKNKSKRV